jgi:diguanylate cyclase (GGDEF)-like protein/PAS domain S-box-containing protein
MSVFRDHPLRLNHPLGRMAQDPSGARAGQSQARLHAEQVALVYRHATVTFTAGLLVVLCVVLALREQVPQATLMLWSGVTVALYLVRFVFTRRYRAGVESVRQDAAWDTGFRLGAFASGILWGVLGFALLPQDSIVHVALIAVVLSSIGAASVVAYAPLRGTAEVFIIPALAPLALQLLVSGDPLQRLLGIVVLISLGVLLASAQYLHATTRNQLRCGLMNADLITDLQDANAESKRLNADLTLEISERRGTEAALQRERERLLVTLESIGDGVITADAAGNVEYLNPVAERLTGWSQAQAKGKPLTEVFHLVDEETRQLIDDPVRVSGRARERVTLPGYPILLQHGVDTEHSVEVTATPVLAGAEVVRTAVVFRDVTDLRALAEAMAFQATHDALTGLANRREFEIRLDKAIASARSQGLEHAMCYLDLDQFRVINDTCGHIVGDELLKELATYLQPRLRETDTLARLGGDEFGVLLEGCPLARAEQIAEGLREAVRAYRFVWEDRTFDIAASIGLVAINADSESITQILSAADSACYVAKDRGRNRVHIFRSDDVALARRHSQMQWVYRLQDALENNRFSLHYQSVAPVQESGAAGRRPYHEILVRMLDAEGKSIAPMNFIPAAERYHLMPAIDRWVIRQGLAILAHKQDWYEGEVYAFNLSGQSLGDEGFLAFISAGIDGSGVAAEHIGFEITETAAIANLWSAQRLITVLKARGCRFALDDFGTGLSSFAYLKRLSVDFLKIDGRFIRHIIDDPVDCAMVESINQLSHVVGIQTIAEFVETPAILARLREIGIDYAQGDGIDPIRPLQFDN